MATTASITDRTIDGNGVISIQYADGTGQQFPNLEGLEFFLQGIDDDPDFTKKLLLSYWLVRDPDLSNLAIVRNKDFIFDVSNANPIRLQ